MKDINEARKAQGLEKTTIFNREHFVGLVTVVNKEVSDHFAKAKILLDLYLGFKKANETYEIELPSNLMNLREKFAKSEITAGQVEECLRELVAIITHPKYDDVFNNCIAVVPDIFFLDSERIFENFNEARSKQENSKTIEQDVTKAAREQLRNVDELHQKYLHEDDGKLSILRGNVVKSAVSCGSEVHIHFENGHTLSFYSMSGEVPFILK